MSSAEPQGAIPIKEARANFGNLVRDAGLDGRIVYLSDRGRVIAAIAPLDVIEAGRRALRGGEDDAGEPHATD
ncbi:hypothetical protein [Glycomyces sp. NPDC047010]|uniref:hypothetical protein n=1 Tax=Glycomyces sp. NPDC047010 TaxID=3155023 RepID=UPI0033E17278